MKLKFFNLCKKLRLNSDHHSHQMACVIAKGNRLLSTGFNKYKTHTKSNHPYSMVHAEIDALLKADPNDLIGAEAYIYRETKDGSLAMSRPCISCYSALQDSGIRVIFFSSREGFLKETI